MSYLHLYASFCCFGAFEVLLQATQHTEEFLQGPTSLLSHNQNILNISFLLLSSEVQELSIK